MHTIYNEKRNLVSYIEYNGPYNGINVSEVGRETISYRNQLENRAYRTSYIVHFLLDGEGVFQIDDRSYTLSPGKAFVITPENLVSYRALPGEKWTYCWFALIGTDCAKLFSQTGLTQENCVFDFDDSDIAPLNALLDELTEYAKAKKHPDPAFCLNIFSVCYQVLGNLAKLHNADAKNDLTQNRSIVETAVAYMKNNLHRPFNIIELCKQLCISRSYFTTTFRHALKQTPYSYLSSLRCSRASELLLKNPDLRVYEIGNMLGFSSTSQFCKTFQQYNSCSPSEFRARYAVGNEAESN